MSRFRMLLFNDRRRHLKEIAPTIGVYGENLDEAVTMAQRIWDRLAGEDPALGYSLLDTRTGRICYVEVRESCSVKLVAKV
jgi:hypothetical protein